jgi:aldose 1-epimerase
MSDVPDALPPSGEQIELAYGDQHAVVVSVGAGIRSYEVAGRAVFDSYDVGAMCDGARGQTLIPWPNRVRDGKWRWQGGDMQLALTEPSQLNAIHGLVRWLGWAVADRSDSAVTLRCTSYPQPGYVWPLDVQVRYGLGDDGLTVTSTITNRGTSPAPVAAGAHPYLTAGTALIDECELEVPASTWLPTGDQQIPTGREEVAGSPYDFRSARPIGDTEIDYTYTNLFRDADGRCTVRLRAPSGDVSSLWVGEAYDYVEIFTGDALPEPQRRRQGLGVEPMTAPPNALASGESLVVLEPGQSWTGEWGITAA